jgi:hypothetical protein
MSENKHKPNVILRGPIFPEPVQVVAVSPMGRAVKVSGKGMIWKSSKNPHPISASLPPPRSQIPPMSIPAISLHPLEPLNPKSEKVKIA